MAFQTGIEKNLQVKGCSSCGHREWHQCHTSWEMQRLQATVGPLVWERWLSLRHEEPAGLHGRQSVGSLSMWFCCWIVGLRRRGPMGLAGHYINPLRTRLSTLYAPMNERRPRTVFGGSTLANAAMRCGLGLIVPIDQIQPKIVADFGAIHVLVALSTRLFLFGAPSTRDQLDNRSDGESPPTWRSSAIFVTKPSWMNSPRTLLSSSSNTVSESGMPIADRV